MAISPQNTGPAPPPPTHEVGRAQHPAQHSYLGPASSPAVYQFSIRLLLLSLARVQQLAFRPSKSPVGPNCGPRAEKPGSNLTPMLPTRGGKVSPKPGPVAKPPPHEVWRAQHQAQYSFLGPALGPAVYPFSIGLLLLSPA